MNSTISQRTAEVTSKVGQRAQREKIKARMKNTVIVTEGKIQLHCLFAFALFIFHIS